MNAKSKSTAVLCVTVVLSLAAGISLAPAEDASRRAAEDILDATGVEGGLVVHLGCGDGNLTAALRADDRFLVQGLDADAANVANARAHAGRLGLRGKVFIDRFDGGRLPYIDNLVNLIVSEDLGPIAMDEVLRVLCPRGVAYVKKGGKWTRTMKARPEQIDQWTHYLHDAGGNAVSHDTVAGPPRHMQWMAAPIWSRHHHTLASISSVVATQNRLFYILDDGPAGTMEVPGRWSVIGRDAFNGMLLWKRPMSSWAYHRKGFRSGPVQLPRTLVAVDDRVYVPLGMSEPVAALDAATGRIVRTYEETGGAEELIVDGGVLLVLTGSPAAEQAAIDPARRGEAAYPNRKTIVALRAETGGLLWKWSSPEANPVPLTLAAESSRVFFQCDGGVMCLDRDSGKQIWNWMPVVADKPKPKADSTAKAAKRKKGKPGKSKTARAVGWSVATLVVHDGIVLLADGAKLSVLSASDGQPLWECPSRPGFRSPADVFVTTGPEGKLVWLGATFTEGRDLRTGEIKKTNTVLADLRTVGHHHRCYREKATDRYILSGHRGIEFLDLVADNHSRNNWVRGTCQYGVMPCNGLIYAPSHACGCFMETKLFGFWAVAPQRQSAATAAAEATRAARLERGPAYGSVPPPKTGGSADWPTHRGNAMRSGAADCRVAAELQPRWKTRIGGKITQPVIADEKLLVASVDTHTVHALNASDGGRLWTFTAGGRVDSSPTIHRGLVLFGCADGWVYCLRLADGELAWRFRAAAAEIKTVVLDQVESVWPVHGNVLVQDGIAYFAAGRSSWLDGGISLYGVDPATGKVIHQSVLRSNHPRFGEGKDETAEQYATRFVQNATDYKTFKASDRSDAFSMAEGGLNDVLVGDGQSVFLRHLKFNAKLEKQDRMSPHLFSTSRLLDGAENHRSHWVFGTGDFSRLSVAYSWITYKPGNWGSQLSVPYGLMLTFDDATVWGVRRAHLGGLKVERGGASKYALFAANTPRQSDADMHLPDFRKASQENALKFLWTAGLSMRPRAMLRAGDILLLGGMTDQIDQQDPFAAGEGRRGGLVQAVSSADGGKLAECELESPPVWDGMAAAAGRLYLATMDGRVVCLGR